MCSKTDVGVLLTRESWSNETLDGPDQARGAIGGHQQRVAQAPALEVLEECPTALSVLLRPGQERGGRFAGRVLDKICFRNGGPSELATKPEARCPW